MSDPVADFLAREKEDLAGVDDFDEEFGVTAAAGDAASAAAAAEDNMNMIVQEDSAVMGAGGDALDMLEESSSPAHTDLTLNFEALGLATPHAPELDEQEQRSISPQPPPSSALFAEPRQEPEKIRLWREEQRQRLEQKDLEEEKAIEELRATAKKELADWYRKRDEQLDKAKRNNRVAEEELVKERDAELPGQDWERICRLCEFNPKHAKNAKDVSRMRSIFLALKAAESARVVAAN